MKQTFFLVQAHTQSHQSLTIKKRIKNGVLILGFSLNKINQHKSALIALALFNLILLQDMSLKKQAVSQLFRKTLSPRLQKKTFFLDQEHTQQ